MTTTTLERPCIETVIADGELRFGKVAMRRDFVNDVDTVVHRLLNGETVQMQQRGQLASCVQRTIEAVLALKAVGGADGEG